MADNNLIITIGDKFKRFKITDTGQKVPNGTMECTYVSPTRYLFRFAGCSDYPDGYIVKILKTKVKEAYFSACNQAVKI